VSDAQNVVRVLSTLALKGAVGSLAAGYQAGGGARIDADFAPTLALLDRLRAGETADVVILTREALLDLAAKATVVAESCVDLARSFVGIAVKAGADHPDIATPAALRATLLGARAVAYSRLGASGIFFAQLIEQMGIAPQINARAIVIPQGFTAERLVSGEADLAVPAIERTQAGRRHRSGRSDPARVADAGGVFRRPAGGVATDRAVRCFARVPCLAAGGAGVARVRAGALDSPSLRG
jgi:molybdate transport system substrate-binding protein